VPDVTTYDTRGFVLFRLGDEEYGIPIEQVLAIIRYEQPMPVPRAPEGVLGVINLRGRVIPVLDLTARLRVGVFRPGLPSRIVITEVGSGSVGIAVDSASEVVALPNSSIGPVPDSVLSSHTAGLFEGVADRDGALVILLDLEHVMDVAERAQLSRASETEGGADV
jgi:purine-binding chemotaxis protein CheW